MPATYRLPFEKEIYDLEEALARLEVDVEKKLASVEELQRLRRELTNLKRKIYNNLSAWETVLVARHPERPQFLDYVEMLAEDFVELHGDRAFGDDRAIRTGFARIGDYKVMLVGHHKGRNLQERQQCFYGCAHPEGYRKALLKMKLAAKFRVPIISLIDTPGAYPGIGAEERGQAHLIAANLMEMARLPTPIICVVIGEGGSGGALGIGVGDKLAMLEFAYYSVISPEGCAGILWKEATEETKIRAAEALKLTARDLQRLGILDDVIPEPLGGAHRDARATASTLKTYLLRYLRELRDVPTDVLLQRRYEKFRRMGVFLEGEAALASAALQAPVNTDDAQLSHEPLEEVSAEPDQE
ncbi:MAG: acetyl-CoA carboxylase carboxyltransferase subunit alpha [Gemmatales bacterium]|nr:acetyl-CoA carboxylase carboxyltransferase subunit alpha [Gemmatales bacterium]MDW8176143.1 acetyl-CoA carboxylase carboxyltransferase subunit alpha [Gemmatales bacterium]